MVQINRKYAQDQRNVNRQEMVRISSISIMFEHEYDYIVWSHNVPSVLKNL